MLTFNENVTKIVTPKKHKQANYGVVIASKNKTKVVYNAGQIM